MLTWCCTIKVGKRNFQHKTNFPFHPQKVHQPLIKMAFWHFDWFSVVQWWVSHFKQKLNASALGEQVWSAVMGKMYLTSDLQTVCACNAPYLTRVFFQCIATQFGPMDLLIEENACCYYCFYKQQSTYLIPDYNALFSCTMNHSNNEEKLQVAVYRTLVRLSKID